MLDIRIEGLFLLCGCNDVCYEVSIRFRTKINFSLEVHENRGLVLTTTSDRSSISDNVSVHDWYQVTHATELSVDRPGFLAK